MSEPPINVQLDAAYEAFLGAHGVAPNALFMPYRLWEDTSREVLLDPGRPWQYKGCPIRLLSSTEYAAYFALVEKVTVKRR
ncbi:MAG: hypothetical protein ACE5JD_17105 [Candidatus Methylomirabilia bacterium]